MATLIQLQNARKQAEAAGDTEALGVFDEMLANQDYEEESSTVASALQGVGQGTTFGMGEEMGAGVRAAAERYVNPAMYALARKFSPYGGQEDKGVGELYREFQKDYYGQPYGERYAETLQSQRDALQTAREEDPATTFAGELMGGLATGGAGMAKAAAAPTLLKAGARMVPAGAGMGAAGGYGYSEAAPIEKAAFGEQGEWTEEAVKAGLDVGAGATIGGVTAGLTPAVGAGARAVGRLVSRPFTRDARITNEAREAVQAALEEDIEQGFIKSADQLRDDMSQLGISVADAGPMTRQLTEKIAQQPVPAARDVETFLTTRNKEQYKRLFPRLAEALGAKDNFAAARRKVINERAKQADELYGQAYARDVRLTEPMHRILRNPEFKAAIRTANRLRRNRGLEPFPEKVEIGTMINTQELDEIVKGMDDVVTKNYKSAPAIAINITKPLRNEFRDMVYDANPAYKRARTAWSGDMLNEEAMDRGLKIFNADADVVADQMRSMGSSEKMFFKIGALRAVARKLGNKSDTSDLTKGVFDAPNRRDAVRIAFGSTKNFEDFMKYVGGEQRKFLTFAKATGNSDTAKRMMQQSEGMENVGGMLAFAGTGSLLMAGLARRGARKLAPAGKPSTFQKDVAQETVDMLKSADPGILGQIEQRQMQGLLGTGGQPLAVGLPTGGLLATSGLQPGVGEE